MIKKNYEGIISIVAAILVLFSAVVDPKVSMVVAVLALSYLAYYNFMEK
ncbi:MAG: hypothetical protein WAV11_00235 [Minisyncoccia bacterium]